MDAIIGKTFRRGENTVDLDNVIAKDFVLVYFGAHWAPPCRLFTPSLVDFYKKINDPSSEKKIEVVFASIDGNSAAFERNFAEMPWTAIPFTDDTRIQNLKQKFGINGIPTLIVLGRNGDMISFEGRLDIQNHQEGAYEIWQKKQAAI